MQRNTLADTRRAHQLADEIIAMCPDIPNSYRFMAVVNMSYYWFDTSKTQHEYIDKASEFFRKRCP